MKKSFIFYQNWAAMIAELPREVAGELIQTICVYELTGEIKESDSTVAAIFKSIQPMLDRDREKYQKKVERINELNAKRNRADNETKSERNRDEVVTKSTRNRDEIAGVNVNDNVNVNILSKDNNINIVGKPDFESEIKQIVDYLNAKSQSNFKPKTDTTRKSIIARLKEGYTVDDFKRVIDSKVKDWSDSSMREYLRPQTLFRPANFEAYLNEANRPEVKKTKKSFDDYPQNTYDFAELERKLIKN